jgi:hypothetical protein
MVRLGLSRTHYTELLAHLAASRDEQVAFLFTAPPSSDEPLQAVEFFAVPASGFADQSPFYLALTDEIRARVLGRASELGGCLAEVHSHALGPAGFSPTDLSGFEEWVPHVRWRLSGRPYVALVFAGESFDALAWEGEGEEPSPLAELTVGSESLSPTGLTHARLSRSGHGH